MHTNWRSASHLLNMPCGDPDREPLGRLAHNIWKEKRRYAKKREHCFDADGEPTAKWEDCQP